MKKATKREPNFRHLLDTAYLLSSARGHRWFDAVAALRDGTQNLPIAGSVRSAKLLFALGSLTRDLLSVTPEDEKFMEMSSSLSAAYWLGVRDGCRQRLPSPTFRSK